MAQSEPQLEIYGRHTSYNVQKVLWLADELQLSYAHTQVGGRFGGTDTAQFLALSPTGKVPVIRAGEHVVWESNTILRYLANTYARDSWHGADAYQSSQVDRWLDWSIDRLEPAFVGVFWGFYRTPVENRSQAGIRKSVADCESCLTLLGDQLADKPYLNGAEPTLADIATGVFLYRLQTIELDVVMPDNIVKWYQRLSSRQPYQRWVMTDFTELRGRLGY